MATNRTWLLCICWAHYIPTSRCGSSISSNDGSSRTCPDGHTRTATEGFIVGAADARCFKQSPEHTISHSTDPHPRGRHTWLPPLRFPHSRRRAKHIRPWQQYANGTVKGHATRRPTRSATWANEKQTRPDPAFFSVPNVAFQILTKPPPEPRSKHSEISWPYSKAFRRLSGCRVNGSVNMQWIMKCDGSGWMEASLRYPHTHKSASKCGTERVFDNKSSLTIQRMDRLISA